MDALGAWKVTLRVPNQLLAKSRSKGRVRCFAYEDGHLSCRRQGPRAITQQGISHSIALGRGRAYISIRRLQGHDCPAGSRGRQAWFLSRRGVSSLLGVILAGISTRRLMAGLTEAMNFSQQSIYVARCMLAR
jgi:hypothetical protein